MAGQATAGRAHSMAAGGDMHRQVTPAASSAALAAAQYWKEQQAESMQGKRTVLASRTSLTY